ncbi:unnamed protein product [Lactuca virosa]|uniref:Uncharacterized protein n=1 Tax=Lactuca virosa TaxID=75947 RepID=A0AAU9MAS7_9ASTR|nr:unnamed protein product [Lactuca virosa]
MKVTLSASYKTHFHLRRPTQITSAPAGRLLILSQATSSSHGDDAPTAIRSLNSVLLKPGNLKTISVCN